MKKNYFLILLFIYSCTYAQWTSNPSINTLIPNANPNNRNAFIVSNSAGGAIIVNRVLNSETNIDLVAHKINAAGVIEWQNNGVLICPTTVAGLPAIVSDGFGGAIICWLDNRSGSFDLYAQRINASGTIMWSPNGILIASGAITNITDNSNIMIADGNGGAIISWRNTVDIAIDSKILLQKISPTGGFLWPSPGVSVSNNIIQAAQEITTDGAGGAIVTWIDLRGALSGNNGYKSSVQRISDSGNVMWGPDGVTIQDIPNVSAGLGNVKINNINEAIIIWSDERNGVDDADVFAQKISSTGEIQWATNGQSICSGPNNQRTTNFFCDSFGNTYASVRSSPNFYVQKINPQGVSEWGSLGLQCNFGQQGSDYASIIPDNAGGVISSWGESTSPGSNLLAQRFSNDGTRIWNSTAIVVSNAFEGQDLHQIISNGNGGAILVWQDYRNEISNNVVDIYAQNICSNGQLGGDCALSIKENTANNNISVFPNPTDSKLNIQLNDNQIIDKVIITDLSGKILIEQTQNNSQINVENLAFGLYIIEAFSNNNKFERKFIKY